MPVAVLALTAGAFGIGTTEFIIMGLLLQVAADMHVSTPTAGLLISGYALGVFAGAPLLTLATRSLPRKQVLLGLMAIFTLGNAACALASSYPLLMAARVLTSLAHGAFFGVGSVVAAGLVAPERRASAIAVMFAGLTMATLIGVPFGAWIGLAFGWRAVFWAVAAIGLLAMLVLARFVPADAGGETAAAPIREELAVLARPQVQLALAMTVLGFGGVFAVFTYIQPMLAQITGFSAQAISAVLLVFGLGVSIGNLAGGRFADRNLALAVPATLALLMLVLLALPLAVPLKLPAVALVGLLGAAGFATVAPLQLRVLEAAGPAGQTLASSLNIAAFNLGNALGAWAGGQAIAHGPGLASLPLVGAALTAAGLGLALLAARGERRSRACAA